MSCVDKSWLRISSMQPCPTRRRTMEYAERPNYKFPAYWRYRDLQTLPILGKESTLFYEGLGSIRNVYFTMPDCQLDTDTLNDETYSMQSAFGLAMEFDITPWRPAVDDEFQLELDYYVVVQVEQGLCKTMECPDNYLYNAKIYVLWWQPLALRNLDD